jgi:hypothetical protein
MAGGLLRRKAVRSLLLTLMASSALAQNPVTPVSFGIRETPEATDDQLVIGASACGTSRIVYWVWNQIGTQPCNNLRIWATDGSCGNEPGAKDLEFPSVSPILINTTRQGAITVVINELPGFAAGTTTPCGAAETLTKEHRICASVPTALQCGLQNNTFTTASPLRISYDAQPPNAPIIDSVSSQDKALKVAFTVSSDTAQVIPFSRAQGTADFRRHKTVSLGGGREVVVDELLNGTTYDLRLRAIDAAGNESADSELASGTPKRTVGFWGTYRDAGGTDTGGCTLAPVGLVPLAALLWTIRRRSR